MSSISRSGWLGAATLGVLTLLLLLRPRLWPYVLASAAPGLALASRGLVYGWNVDGALALFAMPTLVFGFPLSALGWWWLHRPAARPGTLE